MTSDAPARTKVFISYSHADKEWLKRLQVQLTPLVRAGQLVYWDDDEIRSSDRWDDAIQKALREAKVAVLLVSATFLASDFITQIELPALLKAAKEEGTKIIPVILKPCLFLEDKQLSQFQAVSDPKRPLYSMPKNKQEEVLVKLALEVRDALAAPLTHTPGVEPAPEAPVGAPPPQQTAEHVSDLSSVRFFESSDRYGTGRDWLRLLEETDKEYDMMGIALGSWKRTYKFKETLLKKAESGCRIRVLLMHRENPAIGALIFPDEEKTLDNVCRDVDQSFEYYANLARQHKGIEVRQMRAGYPHFFLTRSDEYALMVQYLYSGTWGIGPLWECGRTFILYDTLKSEFETLWDSNKETAP